MPYWIDLSRRGTKDVVKEAPGLGRVVPKPRRSGLFVCPHSGLTLLGHQERDLVLSRELLRRRTVGPSGHQNTCSPGRRGQMALQSGLGRKLSTRSVWQVPFFSTSGPRSGYLNPKPGTLLPLHKLSQGGPYVSVWKVTHSRPSQSKRQPTQRPGRLQRGSLSGREEPRGLAF